VLLCFKKKKAKENLQRCGDAFLLYFNIKEYQRSKGASVVAVLIHFETLIGFSCRNSENLNERRRNEQPNESVQSKRMPEHNVTEQTNGR